MAIPKIDHEYEAKKDQAKKLIAAGGCHAITFWSRTDAQRLCPEGHEDFPPIEAPIYSSEWVEAAKKAIQLIRSGLEILEPPPASAAEEAATLYPYTDDDEMGKSIIDCMRSAHITCAGMYTGEIEDLKDEIASKETIAEGLSHELEQLKAENSKMREALEGVAERCVATGQNALFRDVVINDILGIATEALKTT